MAYEDFVALLLTRLKQSEALFDLIDPEDQRHTVDANGERHFFCHVAPPSCFASVVELDFDWEGACPDTVLVQVDLKCHIIDRHAPDLELANLDRWAAKMITARQHSFPVPRKTWIPNEMRFQVEECRPAYSWELSSPKMSIEYLSHPQEPPRLQVGEVSLAILVDFVLYDDRGSVDVSPQVDDFVSRLCRLWNEWDKALLEHFNTDIRPPDIGLEVVDLSTHEVNTLFPVPVPERHQRPPIARQLFLLGWEDGLKGRLFAYPDAKTDELVRQAGQVALDAYTAGYEDGKQERADSHDA